jgi:hypothetical protein
MITTDMNLDEQCGRIGNLAHQMEADVLSHWIGSYAPDYTNMQVRLFDWTRAHFDGSTPPELLECIAQLAVAVRNGICNPFSAYLLLGPAGPVPGVDLRRSALPWAMPVNEQVIAVGGQFGDYTIDERPDLTALAIEELARIGGSRAINEILLPDPVFAAAMDFGGLSVSVARKLRRGKICRLKAVRS